MAREKGTGAGRSAGRRGGGGSIAGTVAGGQAVRSGEARFRPANRSPPPHSRQAGCQLFPGSAALLGLSDSLIELKTICHCGRKATMNLRVGPDGQAVKEGAQVEIGGNERYVAMCRRHYKDALAG